MAQPCTQRNDKFLGSGYAQNDAGALAVEFVAVGVAGIFQRLLGSHQSQQLGCIGGLEGRRRNSEFRRIEINRIQKTTPSAVYVIRFFGVIVEIIFRRPVGVRNIRDGIITLINQAPVFLQTGRLWKKTAQHTVKMLKSHS